MNVAAATRAMTETQKRHYLLAAGWSDRVPCWHGESKRPPVRWVHPVTREEFTLGQAIRRCLADELT